MSDPTTSERLPDGVMLDDFERLLEMGEPAEGESDCMNFAVLFELAKFMDEHGRRLLLLARVCHQGAGWGMVLAARTPHPQRARERHPMSETPKSDVDDDPDDRGIM